MDNFSGLLLVDAVTVVVDSAVGCVYFGKVVRR